MDPLERGDIVNASISAAYAGHLERREFLRALACLGVSAAVASPLALHAEQAASVQRRNRQSLLGSYDYVIVGGGSAGCLLANRLSALSEANVLLLEAGQNDLLLPPIHDPREWFSNFGSERMWSTRSVSQANLFQREVDMPFGKTLGGSGGVNAMIWLLGDPRDFAVWARYGGEDWDYESCRTSFRDLERYVGDDSTDRGRDGPFPITRASSDHPLTATFQEAGREMGFAEVQLNGGGQIDGTGVLDFNILEGRRMGPAQVLLEPILDRPNLTVLTGARVRRLLIEDQQVRATEVAWEGTLRTIRVDRELVLAAGALGSPKLLQCSGVGASEVLEAAGVPVRLDLPGVGQGLHDHPLSPGFLFGTSSSLPPYQASSYSTEVYSRTNSTREAPNVHLLTSHFGLGYEDGPQNRAYRILASVAKPTSRGRLTIRSQSIDDPADIDPRYLDTQTDRDAAVEGLDIALNLGSARAFSPLRADLLLPMGVRSADEKLEYFRRSCGTYHHYVGTCRLGIDDNAVVGPDLKVRGVERLRVADASVIPEITCTNTHVAALIVAEKAARHLRENL